MRSRAAIALAGKSMDHTSTFERILRRILISLVLVFFLFPIFWILLMSFQTNETILRIPPSIVF